MRGEISPTATAADEALPFSLTPMAMKLLELAQNKRVMFGAGLLAIFLASIAILSVPPDVPESQTPTTGEPTTNVPTTTATSDPALTITSGQSSSSETSEAATSSTAAVTTTTAPATTTSQAPTPLMAIGDVGRCGAEDPAGVAAIAEQRPGQLVILGDTAYPDGTLEQLQKCFGVPFAALLDRIIPATGNHEYHTEGAADWKTYFGRSETYYSQMVGSWKIIVLDTECSNVGGCDEEDPQQQWLISEINSAPGCVALAMHRPWRVSSKYDRGGREAIHDIALAHNVDLVLTGHEHMYEHIDFGNTHQFVVGTGGSGLRDSGDLVSGSQAIHKAHGLLALELSADSFSWEFVDVTNTVLHSGSADCHSPLE